MQNENNTEPVDRYTRSRWIFGQLAFDRLRDARVLVCGCGGVGGAAIDALYRAGVGHITVVDCDVFDITNQNRQIGSAFVGEKKVEVFARLYPGITPLDICLCENTVKSLDLDGYDIIIDAIDDIPAKVALAHLASDRLLSAMGSGKRLDPSKIVTRSIWQTHGDPFGRKVRSELRKSGFEGDYTVVCSTELPACKALGSFVGVTACFGLHLASIAIQRILIPR